MSGSYPLEQLSEDSCIRCSVHEGGVCICFIGLSSDVIIINTIEDCGVRCVVECSMYKLEAGSEYYVENSERRVGLGGYIARGAAE